MCVQRHIKYSEFLKHIPDFEKVDLEEQRELLWELGFDTQMYHFGVMERLINTAGCKEVTKVLWGVERMDKQWRLKRDSEYRYVSSEEVRDLADQKRYGGSSVRSKTLNTETEGLATTKVDVDGGIRV